ncbi:hypothetical protein [Virgibacillus profundi]|uniref:hypothetical protein n=1 Tax=Virgibacillus profundi TaxID=2024555 RepID=UPI001055A612|nr:hypothetical protein [Virgibacillus profundi]
MSETKSVFLYGKPTASKANALLATQKAYTNLVNTFIEKMAIDHEFLLDLLNNNNQSPRIRELEKQVRKSHQLGSAYGQNAIDMVVKELHNHSVRIRNKVYGYVQQHLRDMIDYISFKSLLNASVKNLDEIQIVKNILEKEKQKKKPSPSKIEEFENLLGKLKSLTEEKRTFYKETVSTLFLENLKYSRLPFIKNAPLQLDSRLSTIEVSHSTKEHFIVFVKLLGEKDRVAFPASTSRNSLRRINQYKTGSLTLTTNKNGKVRIGVPFTKKIKKKAISKKNILSMDAGITDLINTNTGTLMEHFKEWVNFTGS